MKTKSAQFNSVAAVYRSDPAGLLRLLELDEHTPTNWPTTDLAGMFQHQLSAPLEFDLSHEPSPGQTTLDMRSELQQARRAGIRTFEDLLKHPLPPLGVLKLAKAFFKQSGNALRRNSAEQRVAYACYLLSVTVARVRLEKRITNLRDAELRHNIKWALNQAWLGDWAAELLRQGWKMLDD